MTAKQYLQQVKENDADIDNMIADKEHLRALMFSIKSPSAEGERVQTSVNGEARFEALYAKIEKKQHEITQKIDRLIDLKLKVSEQIGQIHDSRFRLILHKRYIQFMSWEEIAKDLRYSREWVIRLHGYALTEFEKIHREMLSKKRQ